MSWIASGLLQSGDLSNALEKASAAKEKLADIERMKGDERVAADGFFGGENCFLANEQQRSSSVPSGWYSVVVVAQYWQLLSRDSGSVLSESLLHLA